MAFVAEASATSSTMRATTVWLGSRVTTRCNTPDPFTVPANTSSPRALATGIDSPVIERWSTSLAPDSTAPSAGIRSPGRTTTRSPTTSSLAATTRSLPSPWTTTA
ncbi:Uncharacterised protein [Mycobacterium tuberculosis]|nr:Uncharacterised protein [Mycobacterium tuberculosis]